VTLSNGGTVAPGRIYVTGRSYGVMGRYKDTMYRSVGAFVQDINPYDPSTGTYALMSVRIKQGFTTIRLSSTRSTLSLRMRYERCYCNWSPEVHWTTLLGHNRRLQTSETAMEVDSTSRIVTGGNIVWQAFSRDAYGWPNRWHKFPYVGKMKFSVAVVELDSVTNLATSLQWHEENGESQVGSH
jgi:hypothetical protein